MTSPARPAPDMRTHLLGLVGSSIHTLSGRENRILRIDGDRTWVGTDRSPEGKPVPISDVQEAAERLYRDGDIEISVASVGTAAHSSEQRSRPCRERRPGFDRPGSGCCNEALTAREDR